MPRDDSSGQNELRRLETVFHAALEHSAGERRAFIANECGGDGDLRREVERLLKRHSDSSNFMNEPVWGREVSIPAPDSVELQSDLQPGDRVGHYRLVRPIGAGGMGAIWLAERDDKHYRQQVALKIIKRGMDTDDILRRFRQERQVLAGLEHSNIARLLDGGATGDGRPFLVMEFVDGERIDEYCERRQLGIENRLRLFQKVCSAVRYAHQRLLVHRDLKPGNILVTEAGEPKLLDFGIAKVLATDDASASLNLTGPQRQVLTLRYAGPEQIRGERATTAGDVYSLGVMLFELLTGSDPYGLTGPSRTEIENAILRTEPDRPSSVRGDLDSEIDAIVLKALAKDTSRRYQSIDALAADIERYLSGEPILAHAPSSLYQLRKLIKRNRLPFAFAVTVFVLVCAFGIVAGVLAFRLDREQEVAQNRFGEVRGLANTMIYDLHDVVASVKGSLPAREMIVGTGLKYLDALADEAGDDLSLQLECAAGYFRIAGIQGNPNDECIGQTEQALESCGKGLRIVDCLFALDPENLDIRRHYASGQHMLGNILGGAGQTARAITSYERAIELWEQSLADDRAAPDDSTPLEKTRSDMAACLERADRFSQAEDQYELVAELIEARLNKSPTDDHARVKLANTLAALGHVRVQLGNMQGAFEPLQTAIDALQRHVDAFPEQANAWRSLVVAKTALGRAHAATGQIGQGRELLEWAVDAHREMIETDPTNVTARRDLGAVYFFLGRLLDASGKTEGALEQFEEMIRIRRTLAEDDPLSTLSKREYAVGQDTVGATLNKLGRIEEALAYHLAAKAAFEQLAQADPENVRNQRSVAISAYYLGQLYRNLGIQETEDARLRAGHWRAALQQFGQSRRIMVALRDADQILPKEADVIEMLGRETANCESALAE